ncbi:helix-turn-helix domain-containing protein [Streptomyces sp. NBC_01428]|uniref:helix-turn-helix domain-containing protein n=1 Tax=Streptomyces sp. NBC_01428 TaxID=2903861 RepID=UPI002E372CC8|nr:helix-turn-helix transcriptional regulator [Streptomyces sp. NBC_01428]
MTLAELRRSQGLTQVQVADLMKIQQSNVSRIERSPVHQLELATIQRYLGAVNADLRLIADFGGNRVELDIEAPAPG